MLSRGFQRDALSNAGFAIDQIIFDDINQSEITLAWDFTVSTSSLGGNDIRYFLAGPAEIRVGNSGDVIYLPQLTGSYDRIVTFIPFLNIHVESFISNGFEEPFEFVFADTLSGESVRLNQLFDVPDEETVPSALGPNAGSAHDDHDTERETEDDGTGGDDLPPATNMADNIDPGAGNDTVFAMGGDDFIDGSGGGIDFYDGGSGKDTVGYASAASGVVANLATGIASGYDIGLDTLVSIENITGTAFDDEITGNGSVNVLNGGAGDDVINAGGANDTVTGGNGADTLNGQAGNDTIEGNANGDVITGGSGNDTLFGGNGNDDLNGQSDGDTLYGGAGGDMLRGGDGIDTLYGDDGNDTLMGNDGSDALNGGDGNDALYGGSNGDTLNGDAGDDTLDGGDGADTLFGGDDDDTLLGSAGNDSLTGGSGTDTLDGGNGIDTLFGGAAADILTGGNGADTLTGGNGSDDFIFANGFGQDVITDFNATNNNEDIDLSAVTAIVDFADLSANHMVQTGSDVVITVGSNTITLTGVNLGDLGAGDFLF